MQNYLLKINNLKYLISKKKKTICKNLENSKNLKTNKKQKTYKTRKNKK